jgi:hypothetical protein
MMELTTKTMTDDNTMGSHSATSPVMESSGMGVEPGRLGPVG